jgi:hypothetical protein
LVKIHSDIDASELFVNYMFYEYGAESSPTTEDQTLAFRNLYGSWVDFDKSSSLMPREFVDNLSC